jgi:hypothetical protein
MPDQPKHPEQPLSASHFVNVLAHLESVAAADLIAWDARSSEEAQHRLDRLTALVKRAATAIGRAL